MNKPNQKHDRNQEIYNKYISSDTSYNKLAQKHGLTAQRVQKIVEDFKNTYTSDLLAKTDSVEKRDLHKNKAIEVREKGNLNLSISLFTHVEEWDKANSNYRGLADTYGHMVIVYNKLAQRQSSSAEDKLNYLKLSEFYINEALNLEKEGKLPIGATVINKVHLARVQCLKADLLKSEDAHKVLEEALTNINFAIENLPGSTAHKAWPSNPKAKILMALERYDEAFAAIQQGEKYIYDGYFEEIKPVVKEGRTIIGNDQAVMKIQIWLLNLHVTLAELCIKTDRPQMAKFYATAVIAVSDPEGTLNEIKSAAKEILKKI